MGSEWVSSYAGFKWLKNVDELDINLIREKSPIVCFLKVNLEYPDELHELHNDYTLAPQKLAVSSDLLSNYCKKNADKYEIKIGDVKKINSQFG